MINLISFRFLFASVTVIYHSLSDLASNRKIVRWHTTLDHMHPDYIVIINKVAASQLAIDESGQRLYWINNGTSRYILPVSF